MWLRPSRNSVSSVFKRLTLGNEHGGAQEALQFERHFVRDEVLQQVFREHDADDFVLVVADHGEPRVVRVRDDLQHFLGRLIFRDDDHLAARHHDVADLRVRDFEDALQHRKLVGSDDAALEKAFEELGYVVAGLGVTARP